jgi:BirA family biotin operon repressor/biotin-[acetyl-CoA-carboxylase] ligase
MVKIQFESIDSTNTYIKQHFIELPNKTVIIAKHQTSGKGRLGRIWEDDSTQALFSILLKNNLDITTLEQYPLLSAVAVHQALVKYIPTLKIKWPNDIVTHDLKICGILTESVFNQTLQALIIGIGINVNTKTFPSHLETIASSLHLETLQTFQIESIIDEVIDSLEDVLERFSKDKQSHIEYCNHYSSLTNRLITFTYNGLIQEGKVNEINHEGGLSIQTINGIVHISSGEVLIKK